MDDDIIQIDVILPSGAEIRVPVSAERYHHDLRMDAHTGTSKETRYMQYTMEHVFANADAHDPADVFILQEFGENPTRVPLIITELI